MRFYCASGKGKGGKILQMNKLLFNYLEQGFVPFAHRGSPSLRPKMALDDAPDPRPHVLRCVLGSELPVCRPLWWKTSSQGIRDNLRLFSFWHRLDDYDAPISAIITTRYRHSPTTLPQPPPHLSLMARQTEVTRLRQAAILVAEPSPPLRWSGGGGGMPRKAHHQVLRNICIVDYKHPSA